jgi:hypothetical protein
MIGPGLGNFSNDRDDAAFESRVPKVQARVEWGTFDRSTAYSRRTR